MVRVRVSTSERVSIEFQRPPVPNERKPTFFTCSPTMMPRHSCALSVRCVFRDLSLTMLDEIDPTRKSV